MTGRFMTDLPLSRPFVVATLPNEGLTMEIVADAAERAALAALNETLSIEKLVARLDLKAVGRDGLAVRGLVEADATRACVVTLEPFVEQVRQEVDIRFAPDPDPEDEDAPDPIESGLVDLGAVVSEFFTLGLDLHPRKPGAAFDAAVAGDGAESPFAALKALAKPAEPRG